MEIKAKEELSIEEQIKLNEQAIQESAKKFMEEWKAIKEASRK